ncbi:hypothetical protein [Thiorhodospira sibirica]|uniref:hypothetical protein n=1 Tax=Thiorhodospira sibirica TaxID=154347 RepID=UPI00022C11A7|nr:hypothetical protein [Thiorhodospira sibirica]
MDFHRILKCLVQRMRAVLLLLLSTGMMANAQAQFPPLSLSGEQTSVDLGGLDRLVS